MYNGVSQNMKRDPASSRAATTPQTSCMQKRRNGQGGHQLTAWFVIVCLQMPWGNVAVGNPGQMEVKPRGPLWGRVLTFIVCLMKMSDN